MRVVCMRRMFVVCAWYARRVSIACALYARLYVHASTPVFSRVPCRRALCVRPDIWCLIGVGYSSGGGSPGASMVWLGFVLFAPLVQPSALKTGWTVFGVDRLTAARLLFDIIGGWRLLCWIVELTFWC